MTKFELPVQIDEHEALGILLTVMDTLRVKDMTPDCLLAYMICRETWNQKEAKQKEEQEWNARRN